MLGMPSRGFKERLGITAKRLERAHHARHASCRVVSVSSAPFEWKSTVRLALSQSQPSYHHT